jgi:acetate kinase
MASDTIITVNAGSSSIKMIVFMIKHDMAEATRWFDVSISNIGQPVSILQVKHSVTSIESEEVYAPTYAIASDIIMKTVTKDIPVDTVMAIGHRLVHGGSTFTHPTSLKNIAETDWKILSQLDRQHTPVARQIAAHFTELYPSIPQVACFDTTFFKDLPQVAKIVPIPKKYYEMGVRRYGFHGLSYTSLLATFRKTAGETAANGRVILAHLGSGASVTAVRAHKPVDTTMSLTPVSGIAMSTRSGDLDPNIFNFLHHQNNMSIDEFDHMVNFESGLLGISGITGDMEALIASSEKNEDAAIAVELFVRDVKKAIGALAAVLGGVDSLIFSGGIGEQSSILRTRICEGLEHLGIEINEGANEQHAFLISSESSKVGVHVIASDEASIIAAQTIEVLNNQKERDQL